MQYHNSAYNQYQSNAQSAQTAAADVFHSETGVLLAEFLDSQRLFDDLCVALDTPAFPSQPPVNAMLLAGPRSMRVPAVAVSLPAYHDDDGGGGGGGEGHMSRPMPIQAGGLARDDSPTLSPSDTESAYSVSSSLQQFVGSPSAVSASASLVTRRERNRQAAERCRRKKATLISALQDDCGRLEEKVHLLERENEALRRRLAQLHLMQTDQ